MKHKVFGISFSLPSVQVFHSGTLWLRKFKLPKFIFPGTLWLRKFKLPKFIFPNKRWAIGILLSLILVLVLASLWMEADKKVIHATEVAPNALNGPLILFAAVIIGIILYFIYEAYHARKEKKEEESTAIVGGVITTSKVAKPLSKEAIEANKEFWEEWRYRAWIFISLLIFLALFSEIFPGVAEQWYSSKSGWVRTLIILCLVIMVAVPHKLVQKLLVWGIVILCLIFGWNEYKSEAKAEDGTAQAEVSVGKVANTKGEKTILFIAKQGKLEAIDISSIVPLNYRYDLYCSKDVIFEVTVNEELIDAFRCGDKSFPKFPNMKIWYTSDTKEDQSITLKYRPAGKNPQM